MPERKGKKFFIAAFGCPRRLVDAERIKNYFLANKQLAAASAEEADYIVVVTCGLLKSVEDSCIEYISGVRELKAKLVVYGCLPAMNPKRLNSVYNGKVVFTKNIEEISDSFPELSIKLKNIADANKSVGAFPKKRPMREFIKGKLHFNPRKTFKHIMSFLMKPTSSAPFRAKAGRSDTPYLRDKGALVYPLEKEWGGIGFNSRFFSLRISEGCLGNCSYCNIKKAIGNLKSKSIASILDELRKGIAAKQYQINILASDTGSYGLDIGTSLPELLQAILNEDKRITIEFIQDLNPFWICRYKEQFTELISTQRIKSILTPFQSGNIRILKLMRRPMDLTEFKEVVRSMRSVHPGLKLRTQVIVGFPTETEEEFQDTLNYLKETEFDECDPLAYFEVEGSDSEKFTPKVEARVISERLERIKKELQDFRRPPVNEKTCLVDKV